MNVLDAKDVAQIIKNKPDKIDEAKTYELVKRFFDDRNSRDNKQTDIYQLVLEIKRDPVVSLLPTSLQI